VKGTCALCTQRPASYEVEGDGRILKGTYEGRAIHKGDLICGTCLMSELASDENGNYVVVHHLVKIEPSIV
jgi:hypothetical protein